MADYYPLIVRAIEGLADRSLETRRAVYDRARYALLGQLRSLDPPLSAEDIEHERKSLEAAFVRIEAEYAAPPEPPVEAPPAPAAPPPPPPPIERTYPRAEVVASPSPGLKEVARAEVAASPSPGLKEVARAPAAPADERPAVALKTPPPPAPEVLPPPRESIPEAAPLRDDLAEAPSLRGQTRARAAPPVKAPARTFGSVAKAAPPVQPQPKPALPARPREVELTPAAPQASASPTVAPSFPGGGDAVRLERAGAEIVDVEFTEADRPLRPRVDTRSRVAVRRRRFPAALVGAIVLAAIGGIAGLAWYLRDDPGELQRQPAVAAAPAAPAEGPKLNERVGGQAPSPPPSALPQAPPARVEPGAPQRAVLYEEDPANPNAPKAITGRVVWQLEALNAGQGQALESAIRARIELPDMGFSLSLLIRRNLESTLPASHTVELAFTTPPGEPGRVVRDVGLLQFKTDFAGRGTPAAGLTVPVRENVFLIGLSSIPGDVERNMELLRKAWVDLPVRTVSGQRAVLSFEKGAAGDQVVEDAFRQWR